MPVRRALGGHAVSIRHWAGAAVAALATSCGSSGSVTAPDDPREIRAPSAIAFVDVQLVPMTTNAVAEHRTVIVRDGRIERIEAVGASTLPGDVVVVEGRGRYLAPALVDMHVHARGADLPAYLQAGIATVRNMWGHSGIPGLRASIEQGTRLGPTIHSIGPGLDGSPPQWPETQLVESAEDAVAAVDSLTTFGWATMKIYQRLTRPAFDAIIQAVQARGARAAGHVPTAVPVEHALSSGMTTIEHLSGYDRALTRQPAGGTWAWIDIDESRIPSLVQATLAAGTWNCPTLAIYVQLAQSHPSGERATLLENRRRFVRALSQAGAGLLAGSDAGIDVVPAGESLLDELEEFVRAGLTPYQALRAATIDAGQFLEVPALGTIAVGAPAELILLDGNPLGDIGNVRRLAGLVLRGEWLSAARLAAMTP